MLRTSWSNYDKMNIQKILEMDRHELFNNRILIIGDGDEAFSVVNNILNAGHEVALLTADREGAHTFLRMTNESSLKRLIMLEEWPDYIHCSMVIVVTDEQADPKKKILHQLAIRLPEQTLIAVNTESIPLEELQKEIPQPERLIGLNWCYPAHLTFFLEIISNARTDQDLVAKLETIAQTSWGKDPYIVRSGFSTRARMMAAWAREAIYLVENGYASLESIDRACRNDPGYYLPFAGNFRYMDLMGTYAYGMVMKDLNPDLAKGTHVPEHLASDLAAYMSMNSEDDKEDFLNFSQKIQELILRYPHETLDS